MHTVDRADDDAERGRLDHADSDDRTDSYDLGDGAGRSDIPTRADYSAGAHHRNR